jgi:hypothetical protein
LHDAAPQGLPSAFFLAIAILDLRMAHWVTSFVHGLVEQVALAVRVGLDRVANYLT